MFQKKMIIMMLFVLVTQIFTVNGTANVSVSAQGCALVDGASGWVVYEKNGNERLPMASTTKIMTALLAVEQGTLDENVVVGKESVGVEGSSLNLKEGERLTLEELLQGLMMQSGNDAAVAIAIHIGGDEETFVEMMNAKAQELGLVNTHFANPNGLSEENHYTTAIELGKLSAYAMENPQFAAIVATETEQISLYNKPDEKRYLKNSNKMLRLYEGANGVKTGFTKKAGRCLVSSAKREEINLICVTLNAPDDWNDHTNLLNYGFENLVRENLLETQEINETIPVVGGKNQFICGVNYEAVYQNRLANGTNETSVTIELPRFLYAPIKKGAIVGYGVIKDANGKISRVPLHSDRDIDEIVVKNTIFSNIRKIFNNLVLLFD